MLNASEAKAVSQRSKEPYFKGVLSQTLHDIENQIKLVCTQGSMETNIENIPVNNEFMVSLLDNIQKELKEKGYSTSTKGSSFDNPTFVTLSISWKEAQDAVAEPTQEAP